MAVGTTNRFQYSSLVKWRSGRMKWMEMSMILSEDGGCWRDLFSHPRLLGPPLIYKGYTSYVYLQHPPAIIADLDKFGKSWNSSFLKYFQCIWFWMMCQTDHERIRSDAKYPSESRRARQSLKNTLFFSSKYRFLTKAYAASQIRSWHHYSARTLYCMILYTLSEILLIDMTHTHSSMSVWVLHIEFIGCFLKWWYPKKYFCPTD